MSLLKSIVGAMVISFILLSCGSEREESFRKRELKGEKSILEEKEIEKKVKREVIRIKKSVLNPIIEFDRQKIMVNKEQDLFALIKFNVSEDTLTNKDSRPKINLSMVIDRSGSMGDRNKLNFVKDAALFVVDRIESTDKIGIIEYDDEVNTLWPLKSCTSKQMVKDLINNLRPRGSTNLCGGLISGIEEIKNSFELKRVNRVILLSDGLANHGITNPARIADIVTKAANSGLTVSTIGVGLDYNEDLLQSIAECGRGNYYYIENPIQMKDIFQEELNSIFKTVAKSVQIEFIGEGLVKDVTSYGYKKSENGNRTIITLANMFSGEEKMVLLNLKVNSAKLGKQKLGTFNLSYYDCETEKNVSFSLNLNVNVTNKESEVINSIQKEVTAEAELIRADNEHESYVKQFEQGRKLEAEKNISDLINSLTQKNRTLSDVKLKKKIDALILETDEMKKAERNIQNRKAYLKSSKQKFYLSKKGKRGKYLMQKGDKSYDVKRLQQKLKELNLYNGKVDGKFNNQVIDAVKEYQKQNSMEVDGIAGPKTLKKLGLY